MTREEIERLIADTQRQVGEALRARLSESAERPLTIDEIEALVEEVGREVDSRLEQGLIEEHQEPTGNTAPCPECGQSCRYKDRHETKVLTTHGERSLASRYYYCGSCQCGFYPAHAALGLERRNGERVQAVGGTAPRSGGNALARGDGGCGAGDPSAPPFNGSIAAHPLCLRRIRYPPCESHPD